MASTTKQIFIKESLSIYRSVMSIQTQLSEDKSKATISITGEFIANFHREFRDAYKLDAIDDPAKVHYVVNLSKTTYMDSSALGMLLLLREYAGGDAAHISIKGSNDFIRDIFTITKFDTMFDIQ
jgi:anti-anti-sigma factor